MALTEEEVRNKHEKARCAETKVKTLEVIVNKTTATNVKLNKHKRGGPMLGLGVKKKESMLDILLKQEKAYTKDLSYSTNKSNTEEPHPSCINT